MARSNIIEFARGFQESFQRQQQIELQKQRTERFDRQLIANADFQQANLNIRKQQLDLQERQFERGPQGSFGAVQLGSQTGVINRRTGAITETGFPSARVAGDTGGALPGRFGVAAQLKEAGITGTALTEATQNIPLDLNREEAEGFLLGSEATPFFEQGFLFGFGKSFGRRRGPNVRKEDVGPKFEEFLRKTNFGTATQDQQTGILRAFDESLGQEFKDVPGETEPNIVAKSEVEFDLQSEFFQAIIKKEGNPIGKIIERGGKQFRVTGHDKDGEPLVDEVK